MDSEEPPKGELDDILALCFINWAETLEKLGPSK